jgi:hypothetical protein
LRGDIELNDIGIRQNDEIIAACRGSNKLHKVTIVIKYENPL